MSFPPEPPPCEEHGSIDNYRYARECEVCAEIMAYWREFDIAEARWKEERGGIR